MKYPSYMIAPYEYKWKCMTRTIVNRTGVKDMSDRQDEEIAIEKAKKIERANVMKAEKIENEEIVKMGEKVPKVIRQSCFEMKKCYTSDFVNPIRFRYVYVMISRTKTTGYFKTKRLGDKRYSEPIKVSIKYSNSRKSEYFKDSKHSIICNEPIDWW